MNMLNGLRFVEASGHGPVPFCGMVLREMGAEVVRVAAPTDHVLAENDFLNAGKRIVPLDLKSGDGLQAFLVEVDRADGLLEGFRPGVMERLGAGPDICHSRNPGLIYARMTGYGQTGPLARAPGHDINFIAISGLLHVVGTRDGPPVPPLNIAADFGGGAMFLLSGILGAVIERGRTGRGRVVDVSMAHAAAKLVTSLYGRFAEDPDENVRGLNLVGGGAPFYTTYEAADGRYVAVGALEQRFFDALADAIGLESELRERRLDKAAWPALRARMADIFRTRTRDEWCRELEGTPACLSPVLDLEEAPLHPQHEARHAFASDAGHPRPSAVIR